MPWVLDGPQLAGSGRPLFVVLLVMRSAWAAEVAVLGCSQGIWPFPLSGRVAAPWRWLREGVGGGSLASVEAVAWMTAGNTNQSVARSTR